MTRAGACSMILAATVLLATPWLSKAEYRIEIAKDAVAIAPDAAEPRIALLEDATTPRARAAARDVAAHVGKTISEAFGPLAIVAVGPLSASRTALDSEAPGLGQRLRDRIDRARCADEQTAHAWHRAPWLRGRIQLEDGRTLRVEILRSGIVVDGLLFVEPT